MRELPVLPLFVADDVYGVRDHVELRPRADGQIRLGALRRRDSPR